MLLVVYSVTYPMSCDGQVMMVWCRDGTTPSGWGRGLETLVDESYCRIGVEVLMPGTAVGNGLTEQSANDMGLIPGTIVATPLIDTHAGGIGRIYTVLFKSPNIGYILS